MTDMLANVLNAMKVAEHKGKPSATVRPASKVVKSVLEILKASGYVSDYKVVDDGLSGEVTVQLTGKINDCRVIKPRLPIKAGEWEKYEGRFLPGRELGIIIVSTSKGIMAHTKAKEEKVGGRLLAYVY